MQKISTDGDEDEDLFDWTNEKPKLLLRLHDLIALPVRFLWEPPVPEEQFIE